MLGIPLAFKAYSSVEGCGALWAPMVSALGIVLLVGGYVLHNWVCLDP